MKFNPDFEITLTDRDEFEKLLVQVRWKNIIICEIQKEYGEDNAEMEMHCNDIIFNNREIKFPFADFLEAIKNAQEALSKL